MTLVAKTRIAHLFHSEGVNDFTAIVSQFCRFLGTNDRNKPCSGHFTGIGCEYPIYFFPYLEFRSRDADGKKRREQVGISSSHLSKK